MKTKTKITYEEYMNSSSELHHAFYSQFVTESTMAYILGSLKIEDVKEALENGDKHLNKIKIPYNNMSSRGNWWWDGSPFNYELAKELGLCRSYSTHTCVGKAAAKMLVDKL